MSGISILTPPIAFVVVLLAVVCLYFLLSRVALRRAGHSDGGTRPYACGEESPDQMIQPDYAQFLPFAFFFTILHVAALMVTTVPVGTPAAILIAVIYVLGAVVGLSILYRK